MQSDWRTSDLNSAKRLPTSHPPQARARDERERIRRLQGLRVVLVGGQEKYEDVFDDPADICVLTVGCRPSNSTYPVFSTTIHTNHLSFSFNSRRLICDASWTQSESRFWPEITVLLTDSIVPDMVILALWKVFFLKIGRAHV